MTLPIYQVDAFSDKIFAGNPAAVCPLQSWPEDALMQKIAMENNLAETAFFIPKEDAFELRWFTPAVEVDLCGHATLATAYVIFNFLGYKDEKIKFISPRSGALYVSKKEELLSLNFPSDNIHSIEITEELEKCFTSKPLAAFKGKTDIMLVFENENQIRMANPDFIAISKIHARGLIITARGKQVDFVSRFFGPAVGVNEDPVTGSAHTTLTPYWAEVLQKKNLSAQQLSSRGGSLQCTHLGERVEISGTCSLFLKGEIFV
ncbi:MAG: PhzF family phenazine biosynthesis protein [Chitinophagaceae bacterium]